MLKVNIHKALGRSTKIKFEAQFKVGEITALYGPSGLGKTTVLRLIAGLDQPDEGQIIMGEEEWFSINKNIPLKDRPVGMVFQDYNLFKHMTVLQNLNFASMGHINENFMQFSNRLGLTQLFERKPNELSKGQQQKVSILRSLCQANKVLLLDEPFSALDDDSILELIEMIDQLRRERELIIILVTHRKDVILKMADSVVIMETIEQGTPNELLSRSF